MRVIIFGATGMVGQGVLRECLLDPEITGVLAIGRKHVTAHDAKLAELILPDLTDYRAVESSLGGYDACFFCLGVSSAGMAEAQYRHVTYDLTIAAATVLARLNPGMTFIYVSGTGTDSTERGRLMWARVKGATENALMRLPFKAAYMFRPGVIQPLHGVRSPTAATRILYTLLGPLIPVVKALAPNVVTTTEIVGRAMIEVAKHGAPTRILETRDINDTKGQRSPAGPVRPSAN